MVGWSSFIPPGMAPDFASRQHLENLKQHLVDPIRIVQLFRQAETQLRVLWRYGRTDPRRIDQPGLDSRVSPSGNA